MAECFGRIAVFGGVYSNHLALREVLRDALAQGAEALFCLGDLGAFGPNPDKAFPLLRAYGVRSLQGNYDMSLAQGRDDCFCGYTDPRDNHFARLSYHYTFRHTTDAHKAWMGSWPREIRVALGDHRVLMCHGSPRQINEFLWESATPDGLIRKFLRDAKADVICCTHTGIKWHRTVQAGGELVNVGAIGRPENDGKTNVWYALLTAAPDLQVSFIPVVYDHEALAREMEAEDLPKEFVETIRTGWWTTCLEILPAKERLRGKY